ncbi:MAG: response regulator transcription factor [Chloroflexi bacterium]|nr:response regulator transcription factor [Chloroflexota bacterium]
MTLSGRILIIDDEESLRHTLARILQGAGHEVTTAGNGMEGLAYLSGASFELVYLDIPMPDMSGLEVLKAIHQKHPDTPVVLFTAQPDMNSAIQAVREGASDYLLKPLQPQTIIDRTQAILVKQEKEQRRRTIQSQIEALQTELHGIESAEGGPAGEQGSIATGEDRFFVRGKLRLDLHARKVTIGDRSVSLPPTSFDYLLVLARHSPNVVDYRTLVVEAQGYKADAREAQELAKWHIHHIRQAIEPDASNPSHVINVRGSGYRLVVD